MSHPGCAGGGSHSEISYKDILSKLRVWTQIFLYEFEKIRFFFYLNRKKHGVYCPWLTPVISALGDGGMTAVKLRPA